MRLCHMCFEKWDYGIGYPPCMEGVCASMINGIELRWCLHYVMHCERLMIDESLIVLFMFAYQIRWTLRWEQPQGRDSGKRKENEAGIPAREKEKGWDSSKDMWRGFPQLNDDMVGIPTRERAGIPAKLQGCQFDKQTWRGENWHPKINYTYKWIVWNSVLLVEIWKLVWLLNCCITRSTTRIG